MDLLTVYKSKPRIGDYFCSDISVANIFGFFSIMSNGAWTVFVVDKNYRTGVTEFIGNSIYCNMYEM